MSTRMDLVAKVLEISKSNPSHRLFVPELAESPVVELAKQLQEDFRNQLSHTATATESQQRNVLKKFEPLVHEMLAGLEFLAEYRLVRIPSFYYRQGHFVRRMEIYRGVVPDLDEQPISEDTELIKVDNEHLALLNLEEEVLDLHPLYQVMASEETRHETHLCFFKERKQSKQLLAGESVPGAFPVKLNGFEDFERLQARILETLPGTEE